VVGERGRHEPGLGDGVPVDLQVDGQAVIQVVDGGWKLAVQRLDDLTETKPALGARGVEPASLLQELRDRGHHVSLCCAHAQRRAARSDRRQL
jgi:hypothetical protein